MKSVLIIGCGDIGARVAALASTMTDKVIGVVRSAHSAKSLNEKGVTALVMDLAEKPADGDTAQSKLSTPDLPTPKLPTKDATLFYFVPPPNEGETDPYLENFLSAIAADALPAKFVLLSTTAVYGDCQGQWITEAWQTQPQTSRGKRRLAAETAMRQWAEAHQVPYVILRVGGIYGPKRLPLERIKKGLPILSEELSPFTNRIHEDDLAQICIAAANYNLHEKPGEVFNVADGQPGTMSRYFKDIAAACGLPQPPEIDRQQAQSQMTAGMLSYLEESRRIDNRKLLEELGVQLQYPNLQAALAQMDIPCPHGK